MPQMIANVDGDCEVFSRAIHNYLDNVQSPKSTVRYAFSQCLNLVLRRGALILVSYLMAFNARSTNNLMTSTTYEPKQQQIDNKKLKA